MKQVKLSDFIGKSVSRIQSGKMTIEEVPEHWREAMKEALNA